ncbi:type II toxin-antitoxin system VapC family toxin [Saccharicrinis sp. 156]|uniref:type II toxin-antitoxin system VapC family toxin n=1 Tax=Saccharicrinis sp. 156 TaxID=3417574 RepID=UPI003D343AE6
MSGDKIFIDTNIAIYLLNGDRSLAEILHGRKIYLSFITQLELLGFKDLSAKHISTIKLMLDNFVIIDINNQIKELVIDFRRKYTIKLPDCIVAATALYHDFPIITSDKDFKKLEELNLILYEK